MTVTQALRLIRAKDRIEKNNQAKELRAQRFPGVTNEILDTKINDTENIGFASHVVMAGVMA